jgi:hypothetical protein
MSEISLQELDAQFSELLPEREALGCIKFSIPCHDYDPCQPHHHHHHCEPKPKCDPKPCDPQPAPCPPSHHHVPCDDGSWKGGHGGYGDPNGGGHGGYGDPNGGGHGGYGDPNGAPVTLVTPK